MENRTLIQLFEWYLPEDCGHWRRTAEAAGYLASLGITDVWLPPAYKGQAGVQDVGYGVYDLYDLGEFDQKDTIPTKYGTRDEYIAAIDALHANGLRVLADVVLNHRMGADHLETVRASMCDSRDRRRKLVENKKIRAWTGFRFPARKRKYSAFKWNAEHFTAVDWNQETKTSAVYKLMGRRWSDKVDGEYGNYDYLMDVIDWEANVDPDFHKNRFMEPRVIWENEAGCEEWICYKCKEVSAKRLTIHPGQSITVRDQAAYGIILLQGHGTMGEWTLETPTLIRYGELTHDEYFITEKAAKEGVVITNTSEAEPIVMLKHFAENPELVITE